MHDGKMPYTPTGSDLPLNTPTSADALASSGAPSDTSALRLPVTYRDIPLFAAATDVVAIVVSAVLAGQAYHYTIAPVMGEFSRTMASAVFVAVLFVASMWARKLYEPSLLIVWSDQIRGFFLTWIGAFLLLFSGVFTWGVGKDLSRGTILLFFAIGGLFLLGHRALWRAYLPGALAKGAVRGRNSVVILWEDGQGARLTDLLKRHGYRIAGLYQLGPSAEDSASAIEEVINFVRGQDIDDIFLAPRSGHVVEVLDVAKALRVLPIPVTMIPDPALAELVSNPRYELGSALALEIQRQPLSLSERLAKRAFDLIVASLALILFLPLFALVAAAIKLDSRGSVLFLQTRSGFNGRPFKIYKFRSMTVAEDGEKVGQATKNDKRVTRVGALLRKSSIDELPQLLNVLRGDMSIVGPRPHAMAHDKLFSESVSHYAFRHHVKAGMTGWAQVNGARGETDTIEKIQRRVELDLWYVKHWSLALDFSIIVRTVLVVLQDKNAY
jgi:putative colanic acid biosynthesis UDP-glucose lipid carrier transferase